jgi:hypothetical protein
MGAKKEKEWCLVVTRAIGASVDEEGGCAQSFGPERKWHAGMGEQSADSVIECAEDALSAPIL